MPETNEGQDAEWRPEAPESFLAEFNAAGLTEVMHTMTHFGFHFSNASPDVANGESATFEGKRDDGTTMTITFKKGENYKSPKELDDERDKNELE